MWDLVHLALDTLLATITALLLLREDLLRFLQWRRKMSVVREEVLGQVVLFSRGGDDRWQWQARDLDVRADPGVRFPTLSAARVACACMIFAFFVMEEVTASPAPPFTSGGPSLADPPSQLSCPPAEGPAGE